MDISDEVKRLARAGVDEKIHAIYVLRRETGIGLVLAKQIVETIAAGGEVQLDTPAAAPVSDEPKKQRIQRQIEALEGTERLRALDSEGTGQLIQALGDDEDLLGLVQGTYGRIRGVLAATQKRLLFLSQGADDESTVEAFALDEIFLVHPKAGLRSDSINVFMTGGRKVEFINVEKDLARAFACGLKARGDVHAAESHLLSPGDQLDLLEAKYDGGWVTKEEAAVLKRRILGSLPER